MRFKRFISSAAALVFVLTQSLALTGAAVSASDETCKAAGMTVSNGSVKSENAVITLSGFNVTTVDGVDCVMSTGTGNSNIFINIKDKYWYSENNEPARFEIEYLDKGSCSFTAHYCNEEGQDLSYRTVTKMQNTGELKKVIIDIDDFTACNGVQKTYDLRLRSCGWHTACRGKTYIKSVKIVNRLEHSIDVRAENGEYGRVFDYGEDEMTFTLTNAAGTSVKTDIDWRVRNNDNHLVTSGTVKAVESESGETATAVIHTGTPNCGTYVLEYDVSSVGGEGFSESYTRTADFSVVRTMHEGDKPNSVFSAVLSNTNPYYSDEVLEMARRIGVRSTRSGYSWNTFESISGTYATTSVDDSYRKLMNNYGMTMIKTLSDSNPIYTGDSNVRKYTYDDASLAAYGKAAAYISTIPGIEGVEILNEYNHKDFNMGDQSPASYLKYCKAAYEAVKKANPECKVIVGNLAGYDISFMTKLFELGGFDYCDAVSLHPYQGDSFSVDRYRTQMKALLSLMEKYNVKKEIILTEMGISRTTTVSQGMPEEKRRFYAPQLMLSSQAEGLADQVCWYDFISDGVCEDEREQMWGLVKFPTTLDRYTATDTYVTLAAMSNLVQDAAPQNVLRLDNDYTTVYNFKRFDGKNIVAAWTGKSFDTIGLNLGCESVKAYDMYGTYLGEVKGENGVFTLGLCDDEIVYLEGNFTEFYETEPITGIEENTITAIRGDSFAIKGFDKQGRNISVNVDYDGAAFEQAEETDGTNRPMFKVKDGADGRYHMPVTVTENGTVLYKGIVKVILSDEPIETQIRVIQASENDYTRWQAVVVLTNTSYGNYYSGEVKIKEPERFVGTVRRFSNIAPGETITLKLNIPEFLYKRPEEMICEIKLDNGAVIQKEQKVDFTTAEYAYVKPVIDGKISAGEWPGFVLCEDRAERISQSASRPWKGKEDLSLLMNLLWDEKYLYVAAAVKDDMYYMSGDTANMWKGDCVQIGILEEVAGIENTPTAFTELALGEVDGEAKIYLHNHIGGNPNTEANDFTGCVKRNGDTTVYEYAIPWSVLFEDGYVPKKEITYGFSVCVNDGDGGQRHQWLNYNDGIGSTKNAALFGDLKLLGK